MVRGLCFARHTRCILKSRCSACEHEVYCWGPNSFLVGLPTNHSAKSSVQSDLVNSMIAKKGYLLPINTNNSKKRSTTTKNNKDIHKNKKNNSNNYSKNINTNNTVYSLALQTDKAENSNR